MLIFMAVLIMLIVAYAQCREGVFTSATLCANVVLAGVLTFYFWEPLADVLGDLFAGGMLAGYEDALVLTVLFSCFVIMLRMAVNKLVPQAVYFPGYEQQVGGSLFGLVSGYLVAGFLLCVLQTLPWHENFLTFAPRSDGETALRSYLPPDRVWLALMRHAGAVPLAWKVERDDENPFDRYGTFDGAGTFELRYLRYRRHGDKREALPYEGELDRELGKKS